MKAFGEDDCVKLKWIGVNLNGFLTCHHSTMTKQLDIQLEILVFTGKGEQLYLNMNKLCDRWDT